MKKIMSILLIISFAPLAAQKIVVLAPMELIYKPIRCSWHCAKIAIAIPQFDHFLLLARHYRAIQAGNYMPLKLAHTHMAVAAVGGLSSLHSGIMGLKKELWDRKKEIQN